MADEDDVRVLFGKEAGAKIFFGVPICPHQFLKVDLWVSLTDDNFFFLFSWFFFSFLGLLFWGVGVFVLFLV